MILKCGIAGLGAVGGMYAAYLTEMMAKDYIYCICDPERMDRYEKYGIMVNGKYFDYNLVSSERTDLKMDLIIIAVKFHQLESALESIKNFVGENTIILTAINGVISEETAARRYGWDRVLYCVVQGMDSVKIGNEISYSTLGIMAFGNELNSSFSPKIMDVARFFDLSGFPYEIPLNMKARMWGKFVLNCGVNQVCAAYNVPYGGYQTDGEIREVYIAAMKEAMAVSKANGIDIEADFQYWLNLGDRLTPQSMPSMRQDVLAERKTEIELFGGTVIYLGKKFGVPTPINDMLVKKIKEIESNYLK